MKLMNKKLFDRASPWLLATIYLVLIMGTFIYYQGIPYFSDNNESFSSIIHAKNLIQFNFFDSFGLTDESYGITEASHPFIYTHQGNFPRIFSALLYIMGITSIEWQIIFHLVIVNTLGLYFAYRFFLKNTTPFFAFIYCLFLLTDFVMYFQWQFVTWRVWHSFFLFSSLLLIDNYQSSAKKIISYLTLLNFICLAYFEISYAIFVSAISFFYALFVVRNIKQKIKITSLIFTGLILGFGILITQVILYLGYQGFLQDLYITFTARNYSALLDLEKFNNFKVSVWTFIEANNLVFWENYADSSAITSLIGSLRAYYSYNLLIYSPFLILVISSLFIAFIFRKINNYIKNSNFYEIEHSFINSDYSQLLIKIILSISITAIAFYSLTGNFTLNVGFYSGPESLNINKFSILIGPLLIIFLMNWVLPRKGEYLKNKIDLHEVFLALFYIASVYLLAKFQVRIFNNYIADPFEYYNNLWKRLILFNKFNNLVISAVYICTVISGIFIITGNSFYNIFDRIKITKNLFIFIVSGFFAFIVIWMVLPGYVFSGYFERYAPFLIFFNILVIVLPFYFITCILKHALTKTRSNFNSDNYKFIPDLILNLPLLVIYIFIVWSWGVLQISYFVQFNNTTYKLLKEVREKVHGFSSVVNTYAAPFAVQAGQWSYFDPDFANGYIRKTDKGFFYSNEFKYNWLSDKSKNDTYKFPDYYICFFPVSFNDLAFNNSRCDNTEFIANLNSKKYNFQTLSRVISSDPSGKSKWAIVKLDNDFPPYLAPNKTNQKMINLKIENNTINIDYKFLQQFGKSESKTVINLYKLNSCSNYYDRKLIYTTNSRKFTYEFQKQALYQVSVLPATATKIGSEYFSAPFSMASQAGTAPCSKSPITDYELKNLKIAKSDDQLNTIITWDGLLDSQYYEIEKLSDNGKEYLFEGSVDLPPYRKRIQLLPIIRSGSTSFRVRGCSDWACSKWAYIE